MQNTIIYLIGFSGTGKYSIAKEISKLSGARLVDNQLINNPVFSLVREDGETTLPNAVWRKTWAIRNIVLEVIREISPEHFSFIFTNVLIENDADDAKFFADIANLAQERESKFIPVRLLCEEEELCRRVTSPERNERFKTTDSTKLKERLKTQEVLKIPHKNALELDVSNLSALQAAQKIIAHCNMCS